MPATRYQISSTVTESAVAETVRRVNAQAFALLTRRVEINRRIRSLHRVVRGLRDLATDGASDHGDAAPATPQSAACTPNAERSKQGLETHDSNSSRQHKAGQMRLQSSGCLELHAARLYRACRIALMEAGSAVSLDDIRSRIDRRGSFTFSDSRSADTLITRILNLMTESGEIRCANSGLQLLWQRTLPVHEVDDSQ